MVAGSTDVAVGQLGAARRVQALLTPRRRTRCTAVCAALCLFVLSACPEVMAAPEPAASAAPSFSSASTTPTETTPTTTPTAAAPSSAVPSTAAPSSAVPAASTPAPPAAVPPCRCEAAPTLNRFRVRRKKYFEFSFGSAELFSNQSVTDPAGIVRQRVIPITALNVMGEYLLHPRLAVMTQFLLPLEPESTLTDGELTLNYVPPALSGGLRATAFYIEAIENTVLEGQFLALAGSTMGSLDGDAFYPTLGWRLHVRDARGFTLYLGGSFAFRQNTTGLLYGVGHRF